MAYCITTSTAFFSDSGLGSPYNITVKKKKKERYSNYLYFQNHASENGLA